MNRSRSLIGIPCRRALIFTCGLVLVIVHAGDVRAQTGAGEVNAAVRSWRAAHEAAILEEYRGFLSIPNVASDTPNNRRNADHLREFLLSQQRNRCGDQLPEPNRLPGTQPGIAHLGYARAAQL